MAFRTSNRNKILKRRRIIRRTLLVLLIIAALAVIAGGVLLIINQTEKNKNYKYLASTNAAAEVYIYDDYERRLFRAEAGISRGTKVSVTDEHYTENGRTYVIVEHGRNRYYVNEEFLVDSVDDIILEREKWVRTSTTVYSDYHGCEIEGFVKKGAHLKILAYDELLDDGSIPMYQVQFDDTTGWVFSKYLVDSRREAEKVNDDILDIHKGREFAYELYGGTPECLDWFPYEKPQFEDNVLLDDARCLYVCIKAIEKIDDYIALAKENGANAIVLDIKDGILACPMKTADELSPYSSDIYWWDETTVTNAVNRIKSAGLYLICRIVVFNDILYGRDHPESCIESESAVQTWPSAFSRDVWYYNVRLALEVIEKFSPNEIQFDYVRFPEESFSMSLDETTDFKNEYGEEKAEAIQNFCFYAADQIHRENVYLSVDVFAECASAYVTAYGQYFPAISNIVDAVSAMPYTDHYGRSVDTWTVPYPTIYEWATKAAARQKEIETPGLARTWLTCYMVPWWNVSIYCDTEYFGSQAQALYDAGLTGGFLTWNSASSLKTYTMMAPSLGYDYKNGTRFSNGAPIKLKLYEG